MAHAQAAANEPFGTSASMCAIQNMIRQVAPTNSNVLIRGESGTGKDMVARHIHELSARRGQAFVPVNCGAIPADLLESELFGHEKGAFTGALSTRIGRFQFAEGGTMFLDEIGDMPLQMQVKLLRVLQERCIEPVGSNRSIHCDVRIIAATHHDLEAAIRDGRFREDLFYRLNVFPLDIPPLRERISDLPLLIANLQSSRGAARRAPPRLSGPAVECLMQYAWPGNVRELANLLERLSILYPRQVVQARDLPECYQAGCSARLHTPGGRGLPPGGLDLKSHLLTIESKLIREAMEKSHGIVADAARLLGMRRTTLVERMRKSDCMHR
jgi:sigma-54 specific flagellar transcriptional regulator A